MDLTVRYLEGGGLFCQLNLVLSALFVHEKEGINSLAVDWTAPYVAYKDDPSPKVNGWDALFSSNRTFPCTKGALPVHVDNFICHAVHDQNCFHRWVDYAGYYPYFKIRSDTFHKYFRIHPKIVESANTFFRDRIGSRFPIGVHVRFASSHKHEMYRSEPVDIATYIDEAKGLMKRYKARNPILVLASDSDYVIKKFREHFKTLDLVYTPAPRSAYDRQPHEPFDDPKVPKNWETFHAKKPGYYGAVMTLIDVLVLSKCAVFLHSQSNVADWAVTLNPDIDSIFLPRTVAHYPPCECPHAPFHLIPDGDTLWNRYLSRS